MPLLQIYLIWRSHTGNYWYVYNVYLTHLMWAHANVQQGQQLDFNKTFRNDMMAAEFV
jgi:hypothetical protein